MREQIINFFLDYEFIYMFLFCSLMFLATSIVIKKNLIRKISILLCSIFFVLFLFEFFLSFLMPRSVVVRYNTYIKPIDNKIYKQRDIEYFNNNKRSRHIEDDSSYDESKYINYDIVYNLVYSVYSNHFRFTQCNKKSKETYLFLGCSFTYGLGLVDEETLPYYFSQLYDFEKNVINCGVQSKSSNTTLNILNNDLFFPLIEQDSKIKHCFYSLIKDQIYRNFRYEGLCEDIYLYKNNKLYISTNIGKIKYIFARSYIFRKIFLSIIDEYNEKYYEDYMIESLKEINRVVEEKYDSKLTIIVWPDEYSDRFLLNLKETNLDLIFLPKYFNVEKKGYKIKNDNHPTAKANKEIAEMLYNHINKKNKEN